MNPRPCRCHGIKRTVAGVVAARLGIFLGVLIAFFPATAGADESTARRMLETWGLEEAGKHWIVPEEVALRRQLGALPKLERAFFGSRDRFQELIRKYEAFRVQLEKARAALEENAALRKKGSIIASARQQLESEASKVTESIARIEREIKKELDTLDEQSPVTAAAIELVNARNALGLAILAIGRHLDALEPRYAELAKNDQLAGLLEEIPNASGLGPAQNYSAQHRQRLARLADTIFTDGVPVYRRSGQFRVSLLLNEHSPATFSYSGDSGPALLTSSVLQAAGINVDPDAPTTVVRIGNRSVKARGIVVPSLRVGKFTFTNVAAFALPPEAEDLGSRISAQAFESHTATLDPNRLWMKLEKP